MAKSKRLGAKLRQYYKGPAVRPAKVASDEEMKIISEALLECVPKRSAHSFKCMWIDRELELKLVVGLSAGLRLFKRNQVKGMLLCSTAATHLTTLLSAFASKQDVPMLIADRLINLAPNFGMKTLLLVTLADANPSHDGTLYKIGDLLPMQAESSLDLGSFNRLVQVLAHGGSGRDDRFTFKGPVTIQVQATGKSQEKKAIKGAKTLANASETHVVKMEARAE